MKDVCSEVANSASVGAVIHAIPESPHSRSVDMHCSSALNGKSLSGDAS